MNHDFKPVPRINYPALIFKAVRSLLNDLLLGLTIIAGIISMLYLGGLLVEHYPVQTVCVFAVIACITCVAWRVTELEDEAQRVIDEQLQQERLEILREQYHDSNSDSISGL